MAADQSTTKTSTIVPILHLVFTIVSIAVLSYKVYHVESELLLIRDELSTHDRNNGLTKTHTSSPAIIEHSADKRSERNRRLSPKTQETTSTKQNINADCLQKALKDFQVCTSHSRLFTVQSWRVFCLTCKYGIFFWSKYCHVFSLLLKVKNTLNGSGRIFCMRGKYRSISSLTIKVKWLSYCRQGDTPIYGLCRYLPRNRVWFLRFSILE